MFDKLTLINGKKFLLMKLEKKSELTVGHDWVRYVLVKPIMGRSKTVECDDDARNLTLPTLSYNYRN